MHNFEYFNNVKFIFGKDTVTKVGELVAAQGKKVLLHYGGGSIKKSGLYDTIMKSLKESSLEVVELGGVVSNPRLSKVYEGIEVCKAEKIDFILAVGGGSVIDSAKAIAAGVHYDGDVWDLYIGEGNVESTVPLGTILTIPAAGSEVSPNTIITKEEGQLKRGFSHISLRPVFSILNPELTFTLPEYQTTCGMVDMLAHTFERYFTTVRFVEVTDRMSEGLMKSIINIAPKLIADPNNYELRAEIMWAGTIAHNGLLGTGRIEDWASHMIEHEVSGIYDIAHGAGLSIVFPAWMKYVYKNDMPRFAQWANRVFDIEINTFNLEETILKGINALERFYQSINMPIRLTDASIDIERIEEMADKATNNGAGTVGSFVELTRDDIVNIYKLAE
jgi:hypothetical protein